MDVYDILSKFRQRLVNYYEIVKNTNILLTYDRDKSDFIICECGECSCHTQILGNKLNYTGHEPLIVCAARELNDTEYETLLRRVGLFVKYLRGKSKIAAQPSIREQTLDEAKKCILGDREQDYGSPEDNFTTIAKFWSDYLDKDISAQQVADMMILMKVSRIKNGGGTGDSYVDIAGYAACGNEILSKTRK